MGYKHTSLGLKNHIQNFVSFIGLGPSDVTKLHSVQREEPDTLLGLSKKVRKR